MQEDIKILLSTEIDSKGLDQFRKLMNDSRNEMNAMARSLEKGSIEWKNLKASVSEVNRILKLSDADLRKHIDSVNAETLAMEKTKNTAENLITSKTKLRTATSNLGQGIAQTTRAFNSILGASVSLIGSVGTLTPLVTEQGSTFDKVTNKVSEYGTALVGVGVTISNLKYLLPGLNAGFLATAGIFTTLSVGVSAVAAGFGLMYTNLKYAVDLFNSGGGFFDFMTSGAFNQSNAIRDNEKITKDIANVIDKLPNEISLPDEQGPGNQKGKNTYNQEMMKLDNKISKGGKVNENLKEEKQLTNELIDAQKKYNDLLAIESTFTADDRKQLIYVKYLHQIRDVLREISGLQLPASLLNVTGTVATVTGVNIDSTRLKPFEPVKIEEQSRNTYEDVQNTYGAVSSIMSVLNVGTETFVSKLLGGFNTVLVIMEAIKTVNSIFSIIPGFASGGQFSGGPMIVGERGPELLFANTSGYVMNNQDSQRYLNQGLNNQPPPINLYIGANLSPKYFTAQLEKANSRRNYIKV